MDSGLGSVSGSSGGASVSSLGSSLGGSGSLSSLMADPTSQLLSLQQQYQQVTKSSF